MKWSTDAVELLNTLERYTILKAIEEGKHLVTRVLNELKARNKDVEKIDMQSAIQKVLEQVEQEKFNRKTS